MSDLSTTFCFVFIATVVLTRIVLYVRPTSSPTIFNLRLHHYMYGLMLIPVALVLQSVVLYAVGLGLFIDELTFLIRGGGHHKENYSWQSLAGTAFFSVLVIILNGFFLWPFFV